MPRRNRAPTGTAENPIPVYDITPTISFVDLTLDDPPQNAQAPPQNIPAPPANTDPHPFLGYNNWNPFEPSTPPLLFPPVNTKQHSNETCVGSISIGNPTGWQPIETYAEWQEIATPQSEPVPRQTAQISVRPPEFVMPSTNELEADMKEIGEIGEDPEEESSERRSSGKNKAPQESVRHVEEPGREYLVGYDQLNRPLYPPNEVYKEDGKWYAANETFYWPADSPYHEINMGWRNPPSQHGYPHTIPQNTNELVDRALRDVDDFSLKYQEEKNKRIAAEKNQEKTGKKLEKMWRKIYKK